MLQIGLAEDNIEYPNDEQALFQTDCGKPGQPKKILIYFVGGITYAEIAAIRFFNQKLAIQSMQGPKLKYEFVIATTSIINGKRAIE